MSATGSRTAVRRRREGDRWATVGGAAVATTTLLAVLFATGARLPAGVSGGPLGLAGPFVSVLPVAATAGTWLALRRGDPLAPTSAGLRGAFAAGLYAVMVALLFLTMAHLRALFNGGSPDPVFADLVASGLVYLCAFPAATTAGMVVGTLTGVVAAE